MIFHEELLAKVLAGEKTVTRRPAKLEDGGFGGAIFLPCRYKPHGGPGGTYALQGPPEKGSRARARTIPGYRLRVLDVDRMNLGVGFGGFGGFREARREGFPTWDHFRDYWINLYGSYDPTQLVDRIEFEVIRQPKEEVE